MYRQFAACCGIAFLEVLAIGGSPHAESKEWQPVALSEALGEEIDTTERGTYSLFPGISGFISARFFIRDESNYRLQINYRDRGGMVRQKSKSISLESWELTVAHVALVEEYRAYEADASGAGTEVSFRYRDALKYASRAEYHVSQTLLADLLADFPDSPEAARAEVDRSVIQQLAGARGAFFLPGELWDRRGRIDMLIFAGYYGIWAGIATPLYLGADDPQWYAAGMLAGAPTALFLTHLLTRETEIGRGRASIIELGGGLGTWQGLGWAAVADLDGKNAVGTGLLGGLAGIGATTFLTRKVHFSEGHGSLASAALPWGIWFSTVAAVIGDAHDDGILKVLLIGSDVAVVGTAIAARNARMSRARIRLISLMGVVGTAVGFGVDLLAEVNDAKAGFAIAGLGSVAGLAAGARMTRNYDLGRDLASLGPDISTQPWTVSSRVSFAPNPFRDARMMPAASLRLSF